MNEPIIGSIYDCKSENGTHRYQVLSISDGKVFLRSTTDTTEGWVYLANWMATPDRQTLVVETKSAALSSRAGEEMPERPETDCTYDSGGYKARYEEAYRAATADAHFAKLESLVSSLRSQLEAKDAEIAGLSAQLEQAGRLLGEVCCYGTLSHGERAAEPSNHAAVRAILGQIERAEKAESVLSTAERDAIKKALEAVKGERVSRHDELVTIHGQTPLSAEDAILWPYTRAIINAESSILALLPKESAS